MKYKINDWVWFRIQHKAFKGKIRSISKGHRQFVIAGGDCNLAVWHGDIIAPVESNDIPIERPNPIGLFERVAYAINSISMRGQ